MSEQAGNPNSREFRQEGFAFPIHKLPNMREFFLKTWTGRILILNFIVFVITCYKSGSVFMPDLKTLIELGAKDNISIAKGQYWRFITPTFLHVGLLHFVINSVALYQLGYQLERVLGARWYLALYLICGVFAFICSCAFTLAISAGASGALFGLLGSGFYLERIIGEKIHEVTGKKPRQGIFSGTILINIVIGFLIPGIDNAAHLGGMIGGILMTAGLVYVKPNRLKKQDILKGSAFFGALGVLAIFLSVYGGSPYFLKQRLLLAAKKSTDPMQQLLLLNEAMRLAPLDGELKELWEKKQNSPAKQDYFLDDKKQEDDEEEQESIHI